MSQNLNSAVAVIGIDIGKNSFHVVGQDDRGAIGSAPNCSSSGVKRVICDRRHRVGHHSASSMTSSPGRSTYGSIGGSHSSGRALLARDVQAPVDIVHLEHLTPPNHALVRPSA